MTSELDKIQEIYRKIPRTLLSPETSMVYTPENCLGERTLYMNLGYWTEPTQGYDEACEALVAKVMEYAKLEKGMRILDLGCGFGDQDFYIVKRLGPLNIKALNICPFQIAVARARVGSEKNGNEINFCQGNASNLNEPANYYNAIIAVESSAHFRNRGEFFRQAYFALQPGGRIATTDVILKDGAAGIVGRFILWLCQVLWRAPSTNMYSRSIYDRLLKDAGFIETRVESIVENVLPPLMTFGRQRLKSQDLKKRMNPTVRRIMLLGTMIYPYIQNILPIEYVVASGQRPDLATEDRLAHSR